ncbi:MAG: OsmC family protein [Planctomycetes bacterium]|nr:OsmC family protein [Planctomycetota bacterium]
MVEIHLRYDGELRCSATHAPSSRALVTDAPVDNCGRGESFSPTDLVATALGACALTIMGITAQKHAWDLTPLRVRVEKHMIADPVRRIERLVIEVRGGAHLDERARKTLEHAALTCPVEASLGERIVREFRFEWDA